MHADCIHVIREGQAVESGTHSELLAQKAFMPNSIKNNSPGTGRIAALSSYRLSGCAFASFPAFAAAPRQAGRKRVRIDERFGHASVQRPQGHLVWVHAASVGETKSVLPLIDDLLTAYPDRHILLTTGTVTSAEIVAAYQNGQGGDAPSSHSSICAARPQRMG